TSIDCWAEIPASAPCDIAVWRAISSSDTRSRQDAHANSPLAVKRFPKAGSRPGRGTQLEKPPSSELSFLASTGRQPHHALRGRLQELLRQLLVVDGAREDHRADHCRKNRHGLAGGLLALSFVNPKAEHLEIFPDPGFERRLYLGALPGGIRTECCDR